MPPLGRFATTGQLMLKIDIHGARQMRPQILRTPLRAVEPPAHVEQPHGGSGVVLCGALQVDQLRHADQVTHTPSIRT